MDVPRISGYTEKFPIEPSSKVHTSYVSFDVPPAALQASSGRDVTVMFPIDDPALVMDRLELSPSHGENTVVDS